MKNTGTYAINFKSGQFIGIGEVADVEMTEDEIVVFVEKDKVLQVVEKTVKIKK